MDYQLFSDGEWLLNFSSVDDAREYIGYSRTLQAHRHVWEIKKDDVTLAIVRS